MEALTPVVVPCRHEPSHGTHTISIKSTIGLEDGLLIEPLLEQVTREVPIRDTDNPTDEEIGARRRWLMRHAGPLALRLGAVSWDLPEPFSIDALLADYSLARVAAEAAGDLYVGQVITPFLPAPEPTLPSGPTGASTSEAPRSIDSPRKRSSRATSEASAPSAR